jgi:drug/metabolite transporter (DMT)-like permease
MRSARSGRTNNEGRQATSLGSVLQLLTGAFLISFSAVFVKLAHVGPTVSGFYRVFWGAAILLPLALVRRDKLWCGRTPFLLALACGVLFSLDLGCWHRSIHYIGPGLATILGNFQVFILAAVGIFIFKEKINWQFVVSLPLAMAGLYLLVGFDWGELGSEYKLGVLFALLTAATYASFVLVLRKSRSITPRYTTLVNLLMLSAATALVMGGGVRIEGESFAIPDRQSWIALLAYGGVSQVAGWLIITRAIPHVPASRIGLILLLQPTLTFIWDMVFFKRPTTHVEIIGAAMALCAIYLGSVRR